MTTITIDRKLLEEIVELFDYAISTRYPHEILRDIRAALAAPATAPTQPAFESWCASMGFIPTQARYETWQAATAAALERAAEVCEAIENGEKPDGSIAAGLSWECAAAIRALKESKE